MQIEERNPGKFTLGTVMLGVLVLVGIVAAIAVLRAPSESTPEAQLLPLMDTEGEGPFDYSAWTKVLEESVDERGMVDYAGVKEDPGDLDAFLAQLAEVSPATNAAIFTTEEEALAYWVNAYNAWCMKIVADNYPVDSIMDIGEKKGEAFDLEVCDIGGKEMSLNDIEQGIVRVEFLEPRAHFALNCASLGCPPLPRDPFLPETLDEQLDTATRDFLGRKWYLSRLENGNVGVSSILDWYGEDFEKWMEAEGDQPSIAGYISIYAPDEMVSVLQGAELEFTEYDWRLTDQAAEWANTDRS